MMKASDWRLALRNLLRNRRRSVSTMLTLAIGLAAILLFGGFKTNINYSMLTAYVRMEDRLQVLATGFQLYVPKPVEPAELRDVVARLAQMQVAS